MCGSWRRTTAANAGICCMMNQPGALPGSIQLPTRCSADSTATSRCRKFSSWPIWVATRTMSSSRKTFCRYLRNCTPPRYCVAACPMGAQDLLERYNKSQRFRKRRALSNPLALRIPLFDPNRLLDRLAPLARMLFSWTAAWIWMVVVGLAALLAVANGSELAAAIGAKTLSTSEVLIFWTLYPIIKALHELGHGLAVKAWGGEVHETGINLLVFMPVPYVDATAAWAFRDKRRRAMVGAAGIVVELFLAALGILVWLLVEPGLVRRPRAERRAGRRRIDAVVQRQPAAAFRWLLRAGGPDRDTQSGVPIKPLLSLSYPEVCTRPGGCPLSVDCARRTPLVCVLWPGRADLPSFCPGRDSLLSGRRVSDRWCGAGRLGRPDAGVQAALFFTALSVLQSAHGGTAAAWIRRPLACLSH